MQKIIQLEEQVINQIAAGEVVERPASVVKELVENAIDAGATKVDVEISQGGRTIRVADNGSGIEKEDIPLAFSRHATSKIRQEQDLWSLNSLGFRGEALASILSIAEVTCLTRTENADHGYKASNNDNGHLTITEAGCAVGTIMEIKNLFHNVPARLKFLKSDAAEASAVMEVLQNIAIAHPEVAIIGKNNNKINFKTSGRGDLALCLGEIFAKDLLNHLLVANAIDEQKKFFVNGMLSDPTFTKSTRKSIYTVVNGRFVKCPILIKAIERAFEDKIPARRFPLAVINLMLPPEKIDVNVHPTKKEIRYTETNTIFSFITYAVKKALEEGQYYFADAEKTPTTLTPVVPEKRREENYPDTPKIFDVKEGKITSTSSPTETSPPLSTEIEPVKSSFQPVVEDKQSYSPAEPLSKSSITEKKEIQPVAEAKITFDTPKVISENPEPATEQLVFETIKPPVEKKTAMAEKWTVIGQAFDTYIILQSERGLELIDQHIASERAIYDKLKKRPCETSAQRLLILDYIDVTPDQVGLLQDFEEDLARWGYEIDILEEKKVALKQVPHIVMGKEYTVIFEELIKILEEKNSLENLQDDILKLTACHAAVRAGDKLTSLEMEKVIEQWQSSDYPYTCPHGRKICHTISLKELYHYFDRQA